MAACKSSIDDIGVVKIPAASLPMTCKLKNPPSGVTIAEAEFFSAGSSTGNSYAITSGNSFTVPSLPKGTTGTLFVRIVGDYAFGTVIYLVEDCDNESRILAITDRAAKYSSATLEVQ